MAHDRKDIEGVLILMKAVEKVKNDMHGFKMEIQLRNDFTNEISGAILWSEEFHDYIYYTAEELSDDLNTCPSCGEDIDNGDIEEGDEEPPAYKPLNEREMFKKFAEERNPVVAREDFGDGELDAAMEASDPVVSPELVEALTPLVEFDWDAVNGHLRVKTPWPVTDLRPSFPPSFQSTNVEVYEPVVSDSAFRAPGTSEFIRGQMNEQRMDVKEVPLTEPEQCAMTGVDSVENVEKPARPLLYIDYRYDGRIGNIYGVDNPVGFGNHE